MKKILFILLLTPLLFSFRKEFNWSVPINNSTGKITYDGVMAFKDIDKSTIFRRVKKFVAIKDYDRIENIRCKDKSIVTTKFYERSIRFEDTIDGVIIGSGYMPVLWRKFNYIWVVFDYKILANSNTCKYEFTNFRVLNFFAAPKAKSRGSGFATGGYGSVFGTSSSTTMMSANKVQQVPLEEYIKGKGETDSYNMHFRENEQIFTSEMESIRKGLTTAITETF